MPAAEQPAGGRLSCTLGGAFLSSTDAYSPVLGVKGSPVQIRPSRMVIEFFSNIVTSHKSQQRAILLCNGPSRDVRRWGATASLRACATRQSRLRPTAQESKITEPPQICTATPPTANRRTPSAPTGGTGGTCGTRAGQGAQARPAHGAVDGGGRHESRPSDGLLRL